MVLRGRVDVLSFDDSGRLTSRYSIGDETGHMGYETPCATWHTLIAMSDEAAFLEVKEGPYDPATAVEFAQWAPPEGDASAPEFLERLRWAKAGDSFT